MKTHPTPPCVRTSRTPKAFSSVFLCDNVNFITLRTYLVNHAHGQISLKYRYYTLSCPSKQLRHDRLRHGKSSSGMYGAWPQCKPVASRNRKSPLPFSRSAPFSPMIMRESSSRATLNAMRPGKPQHRDGDMTTSSGLDVAKMK